MTNLLDLTVAAHGGLDRFNQLKTLSVHQRLGGPLWALKGQEGALDNARLTVDLHREHVSYVPFKLPNQRTDFTPQRVAVETNEGEVVEERTNPRAAFAGHTQETPWDNLHLIYFASYAMWTYLTCPFTLTLDGVDVTEIEPWQEQGETWRRLQVKFPPYIATHSTEQTFYIGTDGLFRRHDYDVEISGNATAAHYISEYKDVSGMMVPTKHRIYPRQQDNTPLLDLLLVSIDLSDIRFEATRLEANKELVRAYTRTVFNEHQTDRASEFLAPEVKWHGGTLGTVDGLANVAAMLRGFVGALPDLTATEQDIVAEGDTVAVRYVVEATHKGDLMGIPATGRRVRWDAFDVYRVADGKIVEEWAGDDLLVFIHNLGVYTPPWLA